MTASAAPSPDRAPPVERSRYERLIAYYEEAGPDFGQWSAGFNMHFGFYRFGMNPFRREPMLNELNQQVLTRSGLPAMASGLIVDLGCGVVRPCALPRHDFWQARCAASRLFPGRSKPAIAGIAESVCIRGRASS